MISNEIAAIFYVICSMLILVIAVIMVGGCIFSILQAINEYFGHYRR
jgi:hypothetical protein